nr:MAG TPA: hypothetical protein [Caudoviricetes sp.]
MVVLDSRQNIVRSYMVYFLNDVSILISNERVINVFFF